MILNEHGCILNQLGSVKKSGQDLEQLVHFDNLDLKQFGLGSGLEKLECSHNSDSSLEFKPTSKQAIIMWLVASLKAFFCILLQSLTNNVEEHRYCRFELCVSIVSSTDDSSPFCWPNIAILLCNAENVHAHWKLCPPITYFSESFGDARAVQIFILVCHLSL